MKMKCTKGKIRNIVAFIMLFMLMAGNFSTSNVFAAEGISGQKDSNGVDDTDIDDTVDEDKDGIDERECPDLKYYVHMQTTGDQNKVSAGEIAGLPGGGKRLEAVYINLDNNEYDGGIEYATHVQKIGWTSYSKDGAMSGTSGLSRRVEAIKIKLYGELRKYYDVYYRVNVEEYGWLDWTRNGAPAGTASQALRLEGLQIMLVKKGNEINASTTCPYIELGKFAEKRQGKVNYNTHVQTYGDQEYVCDGSVSGTSGEAKRLEGIRIKLDVPEYDGGITYCTHVQTFGWQDWVKDGQKSGTSGLAKRLEGIKIKLYGDVANYYDVYYRVHVQTYGWLGWAKNGEMAGTAGLARRLEGIQIVLVRKGSYSQIIYYGNCGYSSIDANNIGNMSYSQRIALVTEGHGIKNVSKALADSWQTTIVVPTWDFESRNSMNKVTKYRDLTLNKHIANHVYAMFLEIYNSPDKPIIDSELYAYSYRVNVNNPSVLSKHAFGCAIDINASYNPNGQWAKTYEEWRMMPENTVTQKQDKAKVIYAGSSIAKICVKYGFTWGAVWRDAMHMDFID